ncbi:MAG: hypothetical protein B7Z60_03005 [Ferrovum sp. 37-45-19]|nr:MAG: hypothetical protein B7Z65_01075 [Ferrovum sp. 21-44-67]OYV94785.1 MAG: hypothetical protein B7Z60_03005 [Ferrovum sp. 37-45-19]HQT81094.1 hypothetical protein [Ferrovaceae bacterium]HQU06089.1 hypothetical protein [Ferrovaceae bacterium]
MLKTNKESAQVDKFKLSWLLLGALTLSACSSSDSNGDPAPQQWQGVSMQVDTRPNPPEQGMNEIVVTANDIKRNIPAWDLIISIRTAKQDDWVQMIEDGRMGVYRRAVRIEPGERSVLQIQVKHENAVGELRFPLKLTQ